MTVFVALLRGVNVGGHRLAMADLREVVSAQGHAQVATYVQSGNVVFSTASPVSPAGEPALEAALSRAISDTAGYDVPVMVRSGAELASVVSATPFPVDAPKALHAIFLAVPPAEDAVAALLAEAAGTEQVAVSGRVAYLFTPDGFGRSVFAPLVERRLRVRTTARNWTTVTRLLTMAQELEDA